MILVTNRKLPTHPLSVEIFAFAGNLKGSHICSAIMAFKFPTINRRLSVPSFLRNKNIPLFNYSDIREGRKLGSGSFGTVSLATVKSTNQTVVVKKMNEDDVHDQQKRRIFFKEATILHGLENENIVKFLGMCIEPCTLLLEYMYFDFKPFGASDCTVSSLDGFLKFIDDHDLVEQFPFQKKIGLDVCKGLSFLHSKNIAHRDLKPANVLISNHHYCNISDAGSMHEVFEGNPIICKLTDFGESRSEVRILIMFYVWLFKVPRKIILNDIHRYNDITPWKVRPYEFYARSS